MHIWCEQPIENKEMHIWCEQQIEIKNLHFATIKKETKHLMRKFHTRSKVKKYQICLKIFA